MPDYKEMYFALYREVTKVIEQLQEIQMQLMGEVQTEILKNMIFDRFGMDVEFGQGNITYKETIKSAVIGRGHFEPLRHFAEVHILLEPGEPGSGLTYDSVCNGDAGGLDGQHLGDGLACKTALKFLADLFHQLCVHLMIQKAIHLQHITGFYDTVFYVSLF